MLEMTVFRDHDVKEWPEAALERKLITEYLHSRGYSLSDLKNLPKQEASNLMKEACRYAALKLAEIESRSKFCRKIESPH
jgi:hypothetical protein